MTYIKRDFIGHGFCPGIEVAILQCFPSNCLRAARTVVVDAPNDETHKQFHAQDWLTGQCQEPRSARLLPEEVENVLAKIN